jgi:predicted helicase
LREVPAQVRKLLVLPHPDEGIDLIARTRHGEYWAIQSKFRSQRDQALTRRELGTFTSLAFNTCRNIALAVVAHTCTRPVSKRHLMRDTVEIGLDRWQLLDWALIVGRLKGRSARPKARHPRPHRREQSPLRGTTSSATRRREVVSSCRAERARASLRTG